MLAQFWCSKGKSTKHYPPSFTWNQGPVPLEGTQVRCPASAREPNFQLCVCVSKSGTSKMMIFLVPSIFTEGQRVPASKLTPRAHISPLPLSQARRSIRPAASNLKTCRWRCGHPATESAMKWKSTGWLKTYLAALVPNQPLALGGSLGGTWLFGGGSRVPDTKQGHQNPALVQFSRQRVTFEDVWHPKPSGKRSKITRASFQGRLARAVESRFKDSATVPFSTSRPHAVAQHERAEWRDETTALPIKQQNLHERQQGPPAKHLCPQMLTWSALPSSDVF